MHPFPGDSASNVCFFTFSASNPRGFIKMLDHAPTSLESSNSTIASESESPFSAWIKVGAVAAASALAGGLAAAWFYRKTLNRFRQAESDEENSDFGRKSTEVESDT